MRGTGLAFVAFVAVVVAGACNGLTAADERSTDGGFVDASCGGCGEDAGYVNPDSGRAGMCPVEVSASAIHRVHPPKPGTRGSCTDAELASVSDDLAAVLAAVSPTCASCLFSEATDAASSQFFIWTDGSHTTAVVNAGACFGSAYSGGNPDCGVGVEEQQACLALACPKDKMGNTTCPGITNDECITAALTQVCQPYRDAAIAGCGGLSALAGIESQCVDTISGLARGITLLCGGAVPDAGGD